MNVPRFGVSCILIVTVQFCQLAYKLINFLLNYCFLCPRAKNSERIRVLTFCSTVASWTLAHFRTTFTLTKTGSKMCIIYIKVYFFSFLKLPSFVGLPLPKKVSPIGPKFMKHSGMLSKQNVTMWMLHGVLVSWLDCQSGGPSFRFPPRFWMHIFYSFFFSNLQDLLIYFDWLAGSTETGIFRCHTLKHGQLIL